MQSNVYVLPRRFKAPPTPPPRSSAFDDLTDRIVIAQAEAGTLNPNIVAALLLAVRQMPGRTGR